MISETWIAVLVGFVAPIIVYCICSKLFAKSKLQAETSKEDLSSCTSDDCVRCSAYERHKSRALQRLKTLPKVSLAGIVEKALSEQPVFLDEKQKPNVLYLQSLRSQPWWSDDLRFRGDSAALEEGVPLIEAELQTALDRYPTGWKRNTSKGGTWAVFHLVNQGKEDPLNFSLCPNTIKILHNLKDSMLRNVFGNAMFSVVNGDTTIEPHCGPTNIRIRSQLGLQVEDQSASTILVGGVPHGWTEGRCFLFDDSFIHEVHHQGPSQRAVLIADFWHPDLSQNHRDLLNHLFS